MMKKSLIIAVLLFTLFVVNVSAGPLNSFEQNPIPYWDNLSTDIDVTWDSTEQIVIIENDFDDTDDMEGSYYWTEDCSVVTDWNVFAGNAPTTDGDIMSWEVPDDGSWDAIYSNEPSVTYEVGQIIQVRVKTNNSAGTNLLRIQLFTGDGYSGSNSYITDIYPTNVFVTYDRTFSQDVECFNIKSVDGVNTADFEFDFIRIIDYTVDLDIGIPITTQDQQTVELYVNSTFLTSEIRLEIYDDTEALGTYCIFNSSYVIFPDDNYAQTDGLSRIRFSLDNERNTGTITVFAENSSLINQYETSILSGTDFLRMNDPSLIGSIILYYLNGDTTYSAEFSIIEELFLSTGIVGYIGPLALILIGYVVAKKEKILGVVYFVVECLFVAQYLELVEATPDYWWQIFLILIGGLFTCIYPLWNR